MVVDEALQTGDVGDGNPQSLHLGQPLVTRLVRHVLAQAQKGGVDGLHAPTLTSVPLGHEVHGLERMRDVLVHSLLPARC